MHCQQVPLQINDLCWASFNCAAPGFRRYLFPVALSEQLRLLACRQLFMSQDMPLEAISFNDDPTVFTCYAAQLQERHSKVRSTVFALNFSRKVCAGLQQSRVNAHSCPLVFFFLELLTVFSPAMRDLAFH